MGVEKAVNRLMIVTAAFALAFGAGAYHFRNAPHAGAYEDELEVSLCEYIDIDVLRLNVSVIPYDGDRIRISYTNDLPLIIEKGDNSLSISESDEFVISILAESARFGMTVSLPRDIYREITVSTGSGSVSLGALDAERISVSTGSGAVDSEGTRSLVYLSSGSGDITVDFEAVIPESTVITRSGNADILLPKGSSVALDFETETGACECDLIAGRVVGSYMYSINGGRDLIHATLEQGTLTVSGKGQGR